MAARAAPSKRPAVCGVSSFMARPMAGIPVTPWSASSATVRDTMALAGERVQKMLGDYQAPHLDEGIREGLESYVANKKASMPDAFL